MEIKLQFTFPNPYLNFDITDNEVKNAIDKLKVKKATGFV